MNSLKGAIVLAAAATASVLIGAIASEANPGSSSQTPEVFPEWAYPGPGVRPPQASPDTAIRVPGSTMTHRLADLHTMAKAADWFPGDHPTPPAIVLNAPAKAWACGYCHLPDGQGRPENASLAGLPAAYILTQMRAFADGARQSAASGYEPTGFMVAEAKQTAHRDWTAAAAYFSHRPFISRVSVVEAATAPPVAPQVYVNVVKAGPPTPLGERIVETPQSLDDFEARDPHARLIAYVPVGAVAAGSKLAASGGPARQPCALCHGADLKGGLGPPLAGRSPSYIFRQLMAFRAGVRRNPEAAPMRLEAAKLTQSQMIDLAAYSASLKP